MIVIVHQMATNGHFIKQDISHHRLLFYNFFPNPSQEFTDADTDGTSSLSEDFTETPSKGKSSVLHEPSKAQNQDAVVQAWKMPPDERNGELPPVRWPPLNTSMPQAKAWPDDPECSTYNVSFGANLPKAFLVSFPRSGNTWSRYLLESSAGVVSATFYKKKLFKFPHMSGNIFKLKGKALVTKIHKNNRKRVPDDVPVILLIRNPARAIVSLYNYAKGHGKISRNVSYSAYLTEDFKNFVKYQIPNWIKLNSDRLVYSRRLLVIPYEVLREDPISQVRRAHRFLGIPDDEDRLICVEKHVQGYALGLQRTVDPFTAEEKEELREAVANVSALIRQRNFPPLPDYHI